MQPNIVEIKYQKGFIDNHVLLLVGKRHTSQLKKLINKKC